MNEVLDLTGFEGKWAIDLERSQVRDPETGEWVPEWLKDQDIEMRHDGDVQTYRGVVKPADDLTMYLGYTCAFSQSDWVPYAVVDIDGPADHPLLQPNATLKAGTTLGEPIAWVKQVYVDERTHYRISRNLDGTPQYVMLRRLLDDGSVLSTVVDPDGVPTIRKYFTRIAD
ncbi:hypothetical protein ARHIZOSPH14_28330 [Agromyces rhizosphaerae]|uniref:Uncharacterized protein n=1 Tax=Agromyces rhizosphaerae TaxID=88374 RepID=A0A9W6FQI2_9MICO|nr:hypothetical protein [Agromyces rhizosphaerae]GLI28591.1 hypothetical protein ARHIZOSPH14_28330 [Agromyces rhizosphaerae]